MSLMPCLVLNECAASHILEDALYLVLDADPDGRANVLPHVKVGRLDNIPGASAPADGVMDVTMCTHHMPSRLIPPYPFSIINNTDLRLSSFYPSLGTFRAAKAQWCTSLDTLCSRAEVVPGVTDTKEIKSGVTFARFFGGVPIWPFFGSTQEGDTGEYGTLNMNFGGDTDHQRHYPAPQYKSVTNNYAINRPTISNVAMPSSSEIHIDLPNMYLNTRNMPDGSTLIFGARGR
ncbi:hypothetical protein FPV67DRAFT_1668876 [Lyophyllum atratum]|nr:hypothetical protein FPV67DRAFT_1668876 [Lyophyllum atratum]